MFCSTQYVTLPRLESKVIPIYLADSRSYEILIFPPKSSNIPICEGSGTLFCHFRAKFDPRSGSIAHSSLQRKYIHYSVLFVCISSCDLDVRPPNNFPYTQVVRQIQEETRVNERCRCAHEGSLKACQCPPAFKTPSGGCVFLQNVVHPSGTAGLWRLVEPFHG